MVNFMSCLVLCAHFLSATVVIEGSISLKENDSITIRKQYQKISDHTIVITSIFVSALSAREEDKKIRSNMKRHVAHFNRRRQHHCSLEMSPVIEIDFKAICRKDICEMRPAARLLPLMENTLETSGATCVEMVQ